MRILQIIYVIWALLTFLILMLIVLPFTFLTIAFGKVKGGNIMYHIFKVWARIWYVLIFVRHKEIYETPHDRSKQYIFVANHISYMDIPAAVLALHQPVRVLGKYEMVKYPIFGIIYRMAVILVDRRDAAHRAQSVRAMKAAIKRRISMLIFPEGTFNETGNTLKHFYDGAFRIAIETQVPVKPILIVDSLERMHYNSIFSLSPGRSRIVYLNEIEVAGYKLDDLPHLKELVYNAMEQGLKRYKNDLAQRRKD